ncbi:ABC transporter permease [Paenibacillus oenotherae]|uniref:ABC transporter permease n=1 Tax=Paenibacillus oenotherae TaxID=1435645 RepID=A0ABS7D0X2_9BACL|nr:ABC transporter permease [Paenibacillus oenotherae]MBW7473584.1 ABC transporter permease [Paenibacillus oenotherae]
MQAWITMAWYELIQILRLRSVVIIMLILPLFLIFLLGTVFDNQMKPVQVAMHIADRGPLSKEIEAFLQDERTAGLMIVKFASSREEVLNQLREGSVDYGFIVPEDFSEKFLAGGEAVWTAYPGRLDNENLMAEETAGSFLKELETRRAIMLAGAGEGLEQRTESEEIVARISTEFAGEGKAVFGSVSAIQYYAGAYLVMFLLYSGMPAALSLLQEKEKGTLARLYAAPQPFWIIVLGKLTGTGIFAVLQAGIIIVFSWQIFGVSWGNHLGLLVLACLLTSMCAIGLSLVIASIVGTSKATQSIFSTVTVLMTFLTGGMIADLNQNVLNIGKFTINHWAVMTIKRIMEESETTVIWQGIGILAMITAVLLILAFARLKKVVSLHA